MSALDQERDFFCGGTPDFIQVTGTSVDPGGPTWCPRPLPLTPRSLPLCRLPVGGEVGEEGNEARRQRLRCSFTCFMSFGSDTVTGGRRGRTLGWNTGAHRRLWPKALSGRGQGSAVPALGTTARGRMGPGQGGGGHAACEIVSNTRCHGISCAPKVHIWSLGMDGLQGK